MMKPKDNQQPAFSGSVTKKAMHMLYIYFILAWFIIVITLTLMCTLTNACSSSQYFNVGPPFSMFGTTQTDLNLYIGLTFFFFFSSVVQTAGAMLGEVSLFTYYYQSGDLNTEYAGIYKCMSGRTIVWVALCMFNLLNSFFYILNLIGAFSNILFFIATAVGINLTKALVDIPKVFFDQTPNRGDRRKKFLCCDAAAARTGSA